MKAYSFIAAWWARHSQLQPQLPSAEEQVYIANSWRRQVKLLYRCHEGHSPSLLPIGPGTANITTACASDIHHVQLPLAGSAHLRLCEGILLPCCRAAEIQSTAITIGFMLEWVPDILARQAWAGPPYEGHFFTAVRQDNYSQMQA